VIELERDIDFPADIPSNLDPTEPANVPHPSATENERKAQYDRQLALWQQWREREQIKIITENVNYHNPGSFPHHVFPREPNPWERKPGQPGFNDLACKRMQSAFQQEVEAGSFTVKLSTPRTAQPYQKSVPLLVHPDAPCRRMLVVHRVGSGKTMTMIRILDNFFDDPRPKIAVFPSASIANNFYEGECGVEGGEAREVITRGV
jgi:hypothetical protein